jgi:uncharacterized protein (TIGR03382 family)
LLRRITLLSAFFLPAASFATTVWSSDFESGDLSAWTKVQEVSPDRAQIVTDPVRQGSKALKVTVNQYDDPVHSGNDRTELVNLTHEQEGSEYFYRWSVMWDANYPSAPKWQLFTQWHQDGLGGTPPLEMYVVGEEIRLRTGGNEGPVRWTAPLVRGAWQDFILHIKWSPDPQQGFIELYHNGKIALPRTAAPTMLPGQLGYLKMGLYRSREIVPQGIVYFDDVKMATALEDVLQPAAAGAQGSGKWTSGTANSNPNTDPEGPNEGQFDSVGCAASGGGFVPAAAAVALLAFGALFRRRALSRDRRRR